MNATLRWTAPSHNTDGTPITDPISYLIYSFGSEPLPEPIHTTQTHYTLSVSAHLKECFYVKAVVNGRASHGSNLACTKS